MANMDNMIVRQFVQDIDGLIMENNALKKQIRKSKRGLFIFGVATIILGVEVYLIDKELNRQKEILDVTVSGTETTEI